MINMTYNPITGVRYTFDKGQPKSQETVIKNNPIDAQKEIEQTRAKQLHRNNTKQK